MLRYRRLLRRSVMKNYEKFLADGTFARAASAAAGFGYLASLAWGHGGHEHGQHIRLGRRRPGCPFLIVPPRNSAD